MARQLLVENLGLIWNDAAPLDLASPTIAEVTANDTTILDLVGDANGEALVTESVTGFSVTPTQIETPDYVSLQVGKIPGSVSVDDTTMEFYLDDTPANNKVYLGLSEGDTGYVVVIQQPSGTATVGDKCDVWPATVQSKNLKFTGGNEAAKWILNIACGVPTKDGALQT